MFGGDDDIGSWGMEGFVEEREEGEGIFEVWWWWMFEILCLIMYLIFLGIKCLKFLKVRYIFIYI